MENVLVTKIHAAWRFLFSSSHQDTDQFSTPQGRCLRMSLAANTSLGSAGTGRAWWGLVNGWPHLNREQKMKSAVQNYIYIYRLIWI